MNRNISRIVLIMVTLMVAVGLVVNGISMVSAALDPSQPCPPGTGPRGIPAGDYPSEWLFPDQQQWLFDVFNPSEAGKPVSTGYGGERCGGNFSKDSKQSFFDWICSKSDRGPSGIQPASYQDPGLLKPEQRQWLWDEFHPKEAGKQAAIGFGGEMCSWQGGVSLPNPNVQPTQPPRTVDTPVPLNPSNEDTSDWPTGSDGKKFNRNVSFRPGQIPALVQARQASDGGVDLATFCSAMGFDAHPAHGNSQWSWQCPGGPVMTQSYWNQTVCPYVWHVGWVVDNSHGQGTGDLRCKSGGNVSGGGTNPKPSTGFTPRSNTCPPNFPQRLSVGQTAREIPDGHGAANVRPVPGHPQVLTKIQEGETVTIIDGPHCLVSDDGQPYRLFKIRTNAGVEGWTPEADNTHYFLEPWGQQPQQPQPTSHVVEVTFYFQPFDQQYTLEVNAKTCTILNGSAIVAQELGRFTNHVQLLSSGDKVQYALSYFFESIGGDNKGLIERHRAVVESEIYSKTNCRTVMYQVGERFMDSSGLGNVVYGWFMGLWSNVLTEYAIANVAQYFNEKSRGQLWDNPDDVTQRQTGRTLARWVSGGDRLSASLVELAALEEGLM
jgi:hypothetical protein